jgi:gas vesicle protein
LLGAGIGAALVFFLDPERGQKRREMAVERLNGVAQRGTDQMDEVARYTTNKADELADKTANLEINGYTPEFTDAQNLGSTAPSYT